MTNRSWYSIPWDQIPVHSYNPKGKMYTDKELSDILSRYKGEKQEWTPEPGTPRSTDIHLWDIAIISRITASMIYRIANKKNTEGFGFRRRERLSYWLDQIEGGYITKKGHRFYTFHDKPVVRKMALNMNGGGLVLAVKAPTVKPDMQLPKVKDILGILMGN